MLYDTIGTGYALRRQPDPRIAALLHQALDDVESIANVGAGTGSYEIPGKTVVAIEPSTKMLRQRAEGAAPAIQAVAERLPLKDACVSAATAILTIHHWTDLTKGLEELGRIARDRVAILTWDPDGPSFWLTAEYFPGIVEQDLRRFPTASALARTLGPISVQVIPVPHDCVDGFLAAHWRRPEAYLDAAVRSACSGFNELPGLEEGVARLRADLESGAWHRRNGHLLDRDSLDAGYRLVVAEL